MHGLCCWLECSRRLEVETPHGANLAHYYTMNEATTTVAPAPQEIKFTEKNLRNFWKKVNKNGPTMPHMETPCWVWTGAKKNGTYGNVKIGKIYKAHRVAWMIANGPIPHKASHNGTCVCHRCDTTTCVNPSHLFLGDHTDNMRDMTLKRRNGSITKPDRIARGELNGIAKLTTSKVITIRNSYAAGGITLKQLAEQFNVSVSVIHKVVLRKAWKHI